MNIEKGVCQIRQLRENREGSGKWLMPKNIRENQGI